MNFYRPKRKIKNWHFLLIPIAAVTVLIWGNFDHAKEVAVVNEPYALASASFEPGFSIMEKIKEGVELLKKPEPLDYKTKNMTTKKGVTTKNGDLVRKEIALAILNKKTGEIFEKRVWAEEQDIKNYKKTGFLEFKPAISGDSLVIKPYWWNSFNTFYEIADHPELVVIANKYLFPSNYLSGLPEKSSSQYTDIIYVPYSKDLHLPEIIEAGKNYLEKNIDLAFVGLEADKVMSRSAPGQPVGNGISKDLVRNIIIVEHIDPDGFNASKDGGKELSERVLTVIGANQELAFRYTGSPAGASGLAQFIRPTYENMVARYPGARLIKNYNAGMADHVNAIKAMVLFFDSHKKEVASRVTRRDIVESLGITEEMLAATYNGGPSRVAQSVNKYGLTWLTKQLGLSGAGRILRWETLNYVQKFQAVKSLNLFANVSGS